MKTLTYKHDLLESPDLKTISGIIKKGGIGVIPTDTIYGILGPALNKNTVEKIYKLRKRSLKKPMIILIPSIESLKKFNIKINGQTKKFLNKNWPGKVSIVLPCPDNEFEYLHRGTCSLCFRLPKNDFLQKILILTGPLVAPSANWEGHPPASTIIEAKDYFNNQIDFYIDAGKISGASSTIVMFDSKNKLSLVREGDVKFTDLKKTLL